MGAALALASSYILLKFGLSTGVDQLWAGLVRTLCGAALLWGIGLTRGWFKAAWAGLKQYPKVCWMLLIACAAGASGIWFSSEAFNLAPVGIVATLINLQPIMVTIIGGLWYRRQPTWRVIAGSLAAFAGTAMICLR